MSDFIQTSFAGVATRFTTIAVAAAPVKLSGLVRGSRLFCENVVRPALSDYAVEPPLYPYLPPSPDFGGTVIQIDKPPGQLPRFLVGTSEPGVSDFPFVEFIGSFYRETALNDLVSTADQANHARFSVLVNRATSNPVIWDPAVGRSAMARHLDAARSLIERGQLYTFLIQLDEEQAYDEKVLIYLRQLAALPLSERIPVHVEFRHISWHAHSVLQTLSGDGIGIANVEQPTSIDAFPLKAYATTELGYVRYCRRKPYTDAEVAERVRGQVLLGKKVADAAVVWSREYNDLAEDNAASCIGLMRERMTEGAVRGGRGAGSGEAASFAEASEPRGRGSERH